MKTKGFATLCASLFTFFIFSLGTHYLSLLIPSWPVPPWLQFFVLVASLESAYFSAYLLTPRTPVLVRFGELGLWVIPLYVLLGGFNSTFRWSALFVFASWLVAREYGTQLRSMEKVADYLGDQAASTIRWEYESLQHRDQVHLATEYFWWRFWFFGLVLVVLSIGARGLKPPPWILYGGALASGLFLQGLVYLLRLEILWEYGGAQVQPHLGGLWVRSLTILVLALMILVSVLPINYSPLTAERVGILVTSLLNRFTSLPNLPSEPFAGERPPSGGAVELPFEEGELNFMGILLGLIFLVLIAVLVLFVLFVLGWVVVVFFMDEVERLQGLPRLAVQVYRAFTEAWSNFLNWIKDLGDKLPHLGVSRKAGGFIPAFQEQSKHTTKPIFANQGVRDMFRQIVRLGNKQGLVYRKSQTPGEYGQTLGEELSQDQREVETFFKGYERERYSERPPSAEEQGKILASGAKILEELNKR